MLPDLISRRPGLALTAGGGVVGAVGAGLLGVLMIAGVPSVQPAQAPPASVEQAAAAQAAWQDTPAAVALLQALSSPPGGWGKEGDVQRAVTAPFPYSCPQPGAAPAVSLAQTFTVNGARIQVITQAYTAGAGADAMARQVGNVGICSGGDGSATLSKVSGETPGVEAHKAATSRGNVHAAVLSSRRGDVITHIIGPADAPIQALAVAFDGVLNREIQGKCAQMDSHAEDGTRSPWSAAGYKPFTKPEKVSIAAVPLPSIPDGTVGLKVDIPAPAVDLPEAKPSPKPSYLVWPTMPDPIDLPQAPTAPPATAATDTTVDSPAADDPGPGCGWSFTGMTAPAFDPAAAAKTKTDLTLTAMAKLNADGKQWQQSILDYWTSYAAYDKAAKAYKDYSAAVTKVNTAWDTIGKSWDGYNAQLADFRKQTKARSDFLDRQKAAAADYDKAVTACNAPAPAPSPSPSPSAAPTGQPTQSPQAQAPAPRPGCPAQKPAIIDQSAPEVGSEPTPPADPRPKP